MIPGQLINYINKGARTLMYPFPGFCRLAGPPCSRQILHRGRKHSLKPQRLDGYMASGDPDFERKAADLIALYLRPPQHAAVFCVGEKTAI